LCDALCKKYIFFGSHMVFYLTMEWPPRGFHCWFQVDNGRAQWGCLATKPSLLVVSVWFLGHPPSIKTSPSFCHLVNLLEYFAMFHGLNCLFGLACSTPMIQVLDNLIMFSQTNNCFIRIMMATMRTYQRDCIANMLIPCVFLHKIMYPKALKTFSKTNLSMFC
jgi:hypothetical protein